MPNQSGGFFTLLSTYGSLIIATVALVQPWIHSLWKRYFKPGRIDVLPAGNLEVGFSTFGPTVALFGALRAHQRDVFVNEMHLLVKRISDGAEHVLRWRVFRANEMTIGGPPQTKVTFASGTFVRLDAPFKYNILFSQDKFLAAYQGTAYLLRERWHQSVVRESKVLDAQGLAALLTQNPLLIEKLFDNFIQDHSVQSLRRVLKGQLFWKPGTYEMLLNILPAPPAQPSIHSWSFHLQEQEVSSIENNINLCIRELCNMTVQYNFAYPRYEQSET